MLYQIFHDYDVDGGFGDPITQTELVATVDATEEEIAQFLEIWNKPRIYGRPYGELYEHQITARKVEVSSLKDLVPYDPETRDWPDEPEDWNLRGCRWDGHNWVD